MTQKNADPDKSKPGNSKRGEIGLGDLLTSLGELPWETEEQAQMICHALGFNWKHSKPQSIAKHQKQEVFDRNRFRATPVKGKKTATGSGKFSPLPPPELPVELPKNIVNGTLQSLTTEASETTLATDWLNAAYQLLDESTETVAPPRESLFPDLTHRGILGAALTVQKVGQDINMNALIRQVVKGRIPKTLPKNTIGTLEAGCQLLLDYNDSMVPFWADLSALAEQIENLVGKERVSIYEFDQEPGTAQYWLPSGQVKPWKAEPGRPVIVASNLAITGPHKPLAVKPYWHTFIQQCEKLHMPLLFLIPWQEKYWPDVGNYPILIHWNPATSAAMIHRLVGKGHKVTL